MYKRQILDHLPQRLPPQVLAHRAAVVVAVVEVLHIVIGQDIHFVLVSVPKQVRTPLEVAVPLVTARLFVVHITLQQDHPLILSQVPRHNKRVVHTATRQDIHLAIV